MRFGTLWFFHLSKIIPFFKFAIIPCVIIGLYVPVVSTLFSVSWILAGVFAILALLTAFVHVPTDKRMEAFLAKNGTDFENKIKSEFRTYSRMEFLTVETFAPAKAMRANRMLGKKQIYGCLVLLAWVCTKEELWLIRNDVTLYKESPVVTSRYRIDSLSDIHITKHVDEKDDDSIAEVSIELPNERFRVFCRNDYHLNDFLAKWSPKV